MPHVHNVIVSKSPQKVVQLRYSGLGQHNDSSSPVKKLVKRQSQVIAQNDWNRTSPQGFHNPYMHLLGINILVSQLS